MYTQRSGTCWNIPLTPSPTRFWRSPSSFLHPSGPLAMFLLAISYHLPPSLSPLYAFNFLHLCRSHFILSLSSQFCYANEISDDVGALLLGWGEKLTFWLSIAVHLVSGFAREQGVLLLLLLFSLGFSLIDSHHTPQSFAVSLVLTCWLSH